MLWLLDYTTEMTKIENADMFNLRWEYFIIGRFKMDFDFKKEPKEFYATKTKTTIVDVPKNEITI